MSYKYGDWCCKPANEAEAKEIVERAIASGARRCEIPGNLANIYEHSWDCCNSWGVLSGKTHTGSPTGDFRGHAIYTIEELRQKFPLPGDQVEKQKQWRGPEDGLPPVGWHGECNWMKNEEWFECVVLPGGKVAHQHRHSESWVIGDCELLEFRPLRTDRDKWVEDALSLDCDPNQWILSRKDFVGAIYDALQSGELKAPEVTDGK